MIKNKTRFYSRHIELCINQSHLFQWLNNFIHEINLLNITIILLNLKYYKEIDTIYKISSFCITTKKVVMFNKMQIHIEMHYAYYNKHITGFIYGLFENLIFH